MTTQAEPTPHTQDAATDALPPPWASLLDGTFGGPKRTSMNEKPERGRAALAKQSTETLIAQIAPVTKKEEPVLARFSLTSTAPLDESRTIGDADLKLPRLADGSPARRRCPTL
jgi:hypothetical protein